MIRNLYLVYVYMNGYTSPVGPEADKRSKFLALFMWDFQAESERRGKSLDVINRQRTIYFPLY